MLIEKAKKLQKEKNRKAVKKLIYTIIKKGYICKGKYCALSINKSDNSDSNEVYDSGCCNKSINIGVNRNNSSD